MTGDMPYDPALRRDTPLASKLKERIRRDGPLSVAGYMRACLQDPDHGYYVRHQAIGREGDFITAPEISQVFGELIGLWCAVVWQQMGSPATVDLVELGPGRGTLMRDALRAARVLPGFLAAAEIHLVETNARLREQQAATLAGTAVRVSWHERIDAASRPAVPAIVIANEFLDTSPVEQSVFAGGAWLRRGVGLDAAGHLEFTTLGKETLPIPAGLDTAQDGAIFEQATEGPSLASELRGLTGAAPLAALFIDYGHAGPLLGDTLQAVRSHRAEHPLTSPGEADLTAQVDFSAFARHCGAAGLAVDSPVPQAVFLASLGILERASRLMARNPDKAHGIETGVARLVSVPGMGDRFKALAVRSPGLPPLPGFPAV